MGEEGVTEDENDRNTIYTCRNLSKDNKLNTHLKKVSKKEKTKLSCEQNRKRAQTSGREGWHTVVAVILGC